MKKKIILFIGLLLCSIPIKVFAITGNASCYASSNQVYVGDSFNVTVSVSLSETGYIESRELRSSGNITKQFSGTGEIWLEEVSSSSNTYSFKSIGTGTATFEQEFKISDDNGNQESITASCSVEMVQPAPSTSSTEPDTPTSNVGQSSHSYDDTKTDRPDSNLQDASALKSLTIKGVKLTPAFDKNNLEYKGTVNNSIDKINIEATPLIDGSSIDGLGEKELKEGINKFEIKVVASNGEERTYTIEITRKEKDPIEITIDKKKYTILRKDGIITPPKGFVKTTVIIDKQEVTAYSNSYTGYLLVALVDEEGNAGWFIYNKDNSTYTKYSEVYSDSLRLIILKPNKKDIPHRYKALKFNIGNQEVDGYFLAINSPYRLVYAINMANGEKGFYQYDLDQNTFQRFNNIQVNVYIELLKKLEIALIALASIILIMFIIICCQAAYKRKIKKIIKQKKDEDLFKEQVKNAQIKELEKTKELSKTKKLANTTKVEPASEKTEVLDKVSEETTEINRDVLTKEELRKYEKELKRKRKEQAKEFLK